jgi:hypothetical protein
MRHALIRKKAEFIDQFVDAYKRIRKRTSFPHKEVGSIIHFLFPGGSYSGRGAFKTVHKVSSRAKTLVLKTSHFKNITQDVRAYKKLPQTLRNRYLAKIYWRTKYCLLQKYGRKVTMPPMELGRLKAVGKKHGLTDVRPDNVRKVDERFKIVDASVRRRRK